MTYYCTVHKGEDQVALVGEPLDPCSNHMVIDSGYDLAALRSSLQAWKVIWEMEPSASAKFGYCFKRIV